LLFGRSAAAFTEQQVRLGQVAVFHGYTAVAANSTKHADALQNASRAFACYRTYSACDECCVLAGRRCR
jgi:hypothetical protein